MPFATIGADHVKQVAYSAGCNKPVFDAYYKYMADLVNCFAAMEAGDEDRDEAIQLAISDVGFGLNMKNPKVDPAKIEVAFLEVLSVYANSKNLPLPSLPTCELGQVESTPSKPKFNTEAVDKLKRLRDDTTRAHGRQMVEAAKQMKGWFKWIPSGPVSSLMPPELRSKVKPKTSFKPKESWSVTSQDVDGKTTWVEHPEIRNDFIAWLRGTGKVPKVPEPSESSLMNCWEAILFTAYRAGLVEQHTLLEWHREATRSATASANDEDYYRSLFVRLGKGWTVPVDAECGLVPKKGDIVMVDSATGYDHVCLCSGNKVYGLEKTTRIYSLWHHENKTFAEIDLDELNPGRSDLVKILFAPCPF